MAWSPSSSRLLGKNGPQAKTLPASDIMTAATIGAALKRTNFKLHLTIGVEPQPANDQFFTGGQSERQWAV